MQTLNRIVDRNGWGVLCIARNIKDELACPKAKFLDTASKILADLLSWTFISQFQLECRTLSRTMLG